MGAEWTGEFLGMWPCYEVDDVCLWCKKGHWCPFFCLFCMSSFLLFLQSDQFINGEWEGKGRRQTFIESPGSPPTEKGLSS